MTNIKFGTDGWRDIIADNFTFENLKLVSFAIGKFLIDNNFNKKGIFFGYDKRFMSEDFAYECARCMASQNIKIFLPDESVPTPVAAYKVSELGLDGAIMITASHNPPKYNGIKFIPYYGGPAQDEITKEIEENVSYYSENTDKLPELIEKNIFEKIIHRDNDFSSYVNHILSLIKTDVIKKAGFKIIFDAMNGAGSSLMLHILRDILRLEVIAFNTERDCMFGGKLPDPSENNLDYLKEKISENNADIVLALDGDADRFGIIDGKKVFISPNNAIPIILNYLINKNKYSGHEFKAARTVATTHLIDEICKKHNINVVETPVGFKFIGKEMLSGDVIAGGEESGGLSIMGHIPEKDGLLANLLMLEIQSSLKLSGKNYYLSDYLQSLKNEFGNFVNQRLDLKIAREKIPEITEFFANLEGKSINNVKIIKILTKDGVKLILENKSWLLIRASGTEPIIRCYIESPDKVFFIVLKEYINKNIDFILKNGK